MILLGAIAGGLVAAVAGVALLRPTLRRLAVRSAQRHRGETLLIVLGCMLGTAIITGSLLVGDTLDASLRARVPERLGPTDVIISSYAVPVAEAAETTLTLDPPASADGVLPMVTADATLASPGSASGKRKVVPDGRLVEVSFERAARFGGDDAATGISGPTPKPDEVVLGKDAAEELGVSVGSLVEVYAYGQFRLLKVDRVLPRIGVAGYATEFDVGSMNAFVAPGTIAEMAYSSSPSESLRPPEHLLLVSAVGGVFPEGVRTDALLEELRDRLNTLLGYEIDPVKRDLLDAAEEEGDSFAELFLSLGAFAVLAGIALLVNMMVMLAEERRRQLGILRALGMRRSDLVGAFVLEGAIYTVAAAVLGALAGIGVAGLIVLFAKGIFSSAQRGGLTLRFGFEPDTVFLGCLSGVIVSLVVVTATSAWIGRMSVVEAIEDTARRAKPRPRAPILVVTVLGGAAFLFAAAVSIATSDDFGALAFPCLTAALLAAAVLQVSARRPPVHRRLRSLVVSGVAVAVVVWVVLAFPLLDLDVDNATLFVVQGLALILCAVVLLSQQGDRLGSVVRRVGGAAGLVLRVALSYPSARRFRTGTTLLAYGLIVFTLVFSSVLSGVFSSQIKELTVEEGGGFDVLVSTGSADPVATQELMAFKGVEDVATLAWTIAGFRVGSSGTFEDWALSGFGPGFLAGGPPALETFDRDEYPNEAAVWDAVASDPSLAIADVAFLENGGGPPEGNVEVGDEIQIKAPATGETVSRRVVAISAAGAAFSGVMVSQNSLAELVENPVGNRHYVAVSEQADPGVVAAKLERAFLPNGLQARTFREIVQEALRSQEGFFNLIEGYLALGLFVGIAGLGVVMVRAVRERRRQIGVLRALGLSAGAVRAAFLLESGLVALEGVLIGTVLALATSYQLVVNSTAFGDTGVSFAVPWTQLAVLLAGVLGASLVVTLIAAARAAAIPPAAALRTVEEGAA